MDIDDLFPLREPQPVPDCEECVALARKRHVAREVRDLSCVTDCNILLRRHQQSADH